MFPVRLIFALIFTWTNCYQQGHSLQCFVCANVDGNNGPCIRNIVTCMEFEDACLTKEQWTVHPYDEGKMSRRSRVASDRTLFVSKECSSAVECIDTVAKYAANCTRELYSDWTCAQCCSQPLCNYNVPTIEWNKEKRKTWEDGVSVNMV